MPSIVNATTTTGVAVSGDNSGVLALQTNNGTTAVTIDTSQNVGIGTASPSAPLDIQSNSGGTGIRVRGRASANAGAIRYFANDNTTQRARIESNDTSLEINSISSLPITFNTADTERMRITSGGALFLGGTGSLFGDNNQQLAITSSTTGLSIQTSGNRSTGFWTNSGSSGTSNAATYCTFFNNSGQQNTGSITSTGTNCLYNNLSDYRLKEDIAPISNGLSLVSALKPVTFKWASNQTEDVGFIAHEFQEVIPNFVTGNKDAVDEEGKPVYQAMDSSGAIPLLVAAIQELKAELDTVKAELASTNLSLADAKAELNTLKNPPVEGAA